MSDLSSPQIEPAESVAPSRWRIPALVRSSAVYALSAAVGRGLSLLLLPVVTHYLRPAEYGFLVTLQLYLAFGSAMLGSTTQASLPRVLVQQGRGAAGVLVPNLLAFVLAGSLIGMFILAMIASTPLAARMHLALPPVWLIGVPLLAAVDVIWLYHLAVLRFEERPVAYAVSELARGGAAFGTALFFLVGVRAGWQGLALANALVAMLAAAIGLVHLWKAGLVAEPPTLRRTREVARDAFLLLPHALGSFVIALADRLMLGMSFGRTVVGVYGVGYSLGASMTLVTESVNRALAPRVYRDLASPTAAKRRALVRIMYWYIAGAVLLALIAATTANWLVPLITAADYHGAARYVGWIALAFAANGAYSVLFPFLVHAGQTAFLGRATLIAALVNVAATGAMLQWIGPLGAAVATLLAYLVRLALVWRRVASLTPMPWALWRPTSQERGSA